MLLLIILALWWSDRMSWFVIVFQIFVPTDFYSSIQYQSLLPDPCTMCLHFILLFFGFSSQYWGSRGSAVVMAGVFQVR